jgi:hypothetical protein
MGAGVLISRANAGDREFHFQNWFGARLTEVGDLFEVGGRNSQPDFRLVRATDGYELKGLAYPGRVATFDSNSQMPTDRVSQARGRRRCPRRRADSSPRWPRALPDEPTRTPDALPHACGVLPRSPAPVSRAGTRIASRRSRAGCAQGADPTAAAAPGSVGVRPAAWGEAP